MRRKAGKALIYFCVLMLCCTVIARAASAVTVAEVETVKTGKGVLTQTVTGSGSVMFKEQKNQSLPGGQKVKSILIKPQTAVSEGDKILQLDMEYLEEEIEKENREIEKLELQLKQQDTVGQPDARTPETAQAQIALNAASDILNQAQAEYGAAEAEYYNIVNNPPTEDEFPETDSAAADSGNANGGSKSGGSTGGGSGNDSNISGGSGNSSGTSASAYAEARQRWEQEVEAARQKMESAADAVENQTIAYNQAAEQYNLAEQNEANTRKNQEKNNKANAISRQSLQVDIDGAKEKLKKLTEIQEKEGIISAKASGIFQSVGAVEGAFTTGTEQIVIASGEIEAQGIIAAGDVGKITPEDKISVTLSGQSSPVEVKVARLEPLSAGKVDGENILPEQESGVMAWYGELENKNNQIITGSAFTYESSKETGSYDQVVPLSALHQEQGSFYVLAAEIRDGILGKVYTAVRVPATLIDKDEEKAAVKIVADREALIISSSSKYVEEGGTVRLE